MAKEMELIFQCLKLSTFKFVLSLNNKNACFNVYDYDNFDSYAWMKQCAQFFELCHAEKKIGVALLYNSSRQRDFYGYYSNILAIK